MLVVIDGEEVEYRVVDGAVIIAYVRAAQVGRTVLPQCSGYYLSKTDPARLERVREKLMKSLAKRHSPRRKTSK
jgi:hypothetical protein